MENSKDENRIRVKHGHKNKSDRRRSSSRMSQKSKRNSQKSKRHSSEYLIKLPQYAKSRNPFCAGFHYNKSKPKSSSSETSSDYESSSEEEVQPMAPLNRRNYYQPQMMPQMNPYTYPAYYPMHYPYIPQMPYPYPSGYQQPDPWAGYPPMPMNNEMTAPAMGYRMQYPTN